MHEDVELLANGLAFAQKVSKIECADIQMETRASAALALVVDLRVALPGQLAPHELGIRHLLIVWRALVCYQA